MFRGMISPRAAAVKAATVVVDMTTHTAAGGGCLALFGHFAGGGEIAFQGVHFRQPLECAGLNQPSDPPRSTFHTAFYAYFPEYGNCVSLDCDLADGKSLCYDVTYEGSWHGNLMLLPALPAGTRRPAKPLSRWGVQRRGNRGVKTVWQHRPGRRFNSFIVAENVLLAAGHTGADSAETQFLAAINLKDGSDLWLKDLPDRVVKGGSAVNHAGRIFVSLENGRVLAFAAD
jgi:hypothetical protein